jgi:hypothetical protein
MDNIIVHSTEEEEEGTGNASSSTPTEPSPKRTSLDLCSANYRAMVACGKNTNARFEVLAMAQQQTQVALFDTQV